MNLAIWTKKGVSNLANDNSKFSTVNHRTIDSMDNSLAIKLNNDLVRSESHSTACLRARASPSCTNKGRAAINDLHTWMNFVQ